MERFTIKTNSSSKLPYELHDNLNKKVIAAFASDLEAHDYMSMKQDRCLDFNLPGTDIWFTDCKPEETYGAYIVYSTYKGGSKRYIVCSCFDDVLAFFKTKYDAMKWAITKELYEMEESNEGKESL